MIKLLRSLKKKCHKSPKIAIDWFWNGWEEQSKILLAACIESVMMTILEILELDVAWLILYLKSNNSAAVLVINAAWWRILMSSWLAIYMCEMEVVMSLLMLVFNAAIVIDYERVALITIELSSWMWNLLFFSFLHKLKENLSEKMSTIQKPGENSGWVGENTEKTPWDLLLVSTR